MIGSSLEPSQLLILVDRLRGRHLLAASAALTLLFAFAYWDVSDRWPEHSIRLSDGHAPIALLDALYFSFATVTTIGASEFRAVGFSRVLVCLQGVLGLLFGGLIVAMVVSARGRAVRLAAYRAGGDWIEVSRVKSSRKSTTLVSLSTIFSDGDSLRYNGENFDEHGHPVGFFHGELISGDSHHLRFTYSNRESSTTYFVEGVASVLFSSDHPRGVWTHHQATAHDYGTRQQSVYVGFRATPKEAAILRGADTEARKLLIGKYASRPDRSGDTRPR